jgi:hypothetical protein
MHESGFFNAAAKNQVMGEGSRIKNLLYNDFIHNP